MKDFLKVWFLWPLLIGIFLAIAGLIGVLLSYPFIGGGSPNYSESVVFGLLGVAIELQVGRWLLHRFGWARWLFESLFS